MSVRLAPVKLKSEVNMRRLINYIRSCFCKHDWKLLDKAKIWEENYSREDSK